MPKVVSEIHVDPSIPKDHEQFQLAVSVTPRLFIS